MLYSSHLIPRIRNPKRRNQNETHRDKNRANHPLYRNSSLCLLHFSPRRHGLETHETRPLHSGEHTRQFLDIKKGSTTGLYIENHGVLLIANGGIKREFRVHIIDDKSVNIAISDKDVWQIQQSRSNAKGQWDFLDESEVLHIQKNRDDKSSENEEEKIFEFFMVEKRPDTSQSQNEVVKKQLTEFLSIYGNTIGQLKDDDRVTILLHLSEHSYGFGSLHPYKQTEALEKTYETSKKQMEALKKTDEADKKQMEALKKKIETSKKQLETYKKKIEEVKKRHETSKNVAFKIAKPKGKFFEATVTKRDIEAYNRGKIDEQTFQARITFREHKPQPSRDKRIDIMADILTNILKKDTDLRFLSGTQCTGFYQKGIGALFLISQKSNLFGYDWYKRESDENDGLGAFKTAVIETLADYGPTLRDLSPEESIIVHANLIKDSDHKIMRIVRMKKDKTSEIMKSPDRILFRVAKRDIEAYASQKIDLDTLKKRVAITEM